MASFLTFLPLFTRPWLQPRPAAAAAASPESFVDRLLGLAGLHASKTLDCYLVVHTYIHTTMQIKYVD